MARVKGTAVLASIRYVKENLGEDVINGVLAALPEDDRKALGGHLLASAWYSMPAFLHFMEEAEKQLAGKEPDVLRKMGRASADYSLTTVYKIFFKVGSPEFIIGKAARVFGSYYDSGKVVPVESSPGRAAFDLVEFQGAPPFCARIGGWMERTLELAGAKDVRVHHPECLHRGGPRCRFEGTWK